MTHNVLMETLNPAHSLTVFRLLCHCRGYAVYQQSIPLFTSVISRSVWIAW